MLPASGNEIDRKVLLPRFRWTSLCLAFFAAVADPVRRDILRLMKIYLVNRSGTNAQATVTIATFENDADAAARCGMLNALTAALPTDEGAAAQIASLDSELSPDDHTAATLLRLLAPSQPYFWEEVEMGECGCGAG